MKKTNNKGFSLVELIIVIAIMAVLIGVLAPQFIKYVERSRESTDLQNIEEVKTAVETYVADHGEDASLPNTITVTFNRAPGVIKADVSLEEYGIGASGIKSSHQSGQRLHMLTHILHLVRMLTSGTFLLAQLYTSTLQVHQSSKSNTAV